MRSSRAMVVASYIAVIALSQGLFALGLTAQSPDRREWARVPPPGASSEARRCANWTEWSVRVATRQDGGLLATIETGGPSASSGTQDKLPFPVVSDIRGPGRMLWRRIKDGYVVAFNHGEFGGSLWWYS